MMIGMTTSNAQRVRDFHDALGDDYPSTPTVPSPELLALRTRLIDEEHAEVAEAAQQIAERLFRELQPAIERAILKSQSPAS